MSRCSTLRYIEAVSTSILQLTEQESTSNMVLVEEMSIFQELERIIAQEGLEDQVSAEISDRGVILQVKGQALYALGSADLKPEAWAILDRIVTLSQNFRFPLMVEGHTDDLPIHTAQYPSNWELSTARAISAMRYLVEHGVPTGSVGVAGYADTRPVEPNDSQVARAKNRRVEFVFIRMLRDVDGQPIAPVERLSSGGDLVPDGPPADAGADPPRREVSSN